MGDCNRNNCKNTFCAIYSNKYGYICNECFEELKYSFLNINNFLKTDKKLFKQFIEEKLVKITKEYKNIGV